MSSKNSYWITDPDGTYAVVEGADERDRWTRVHGWSVADEEPPADAFVWLRNEDESLGATRMNAQAAQDPAWAGRGWKPGAPEEPVNAATAHWPTARTTADEPASEPEKPAPSRSSSKSTKSTAADSGSADTE